MAQNWWHPDNFEDQKPFLLARMALMKAVRGFFDNQDFWEVDTPILQVCPVMDTHIHGFKTSLLGVDLAHKADYYLHTSPERNSWSQASAIFIKSAMSFVMAKAHHYIARNSL